MTLEQAWTLLAQVLHPMTVDTFLDEVLGKRFVKLEGAAHRSLPDGGRGGIMGENPEQAILDDYVRMAPKIGCHALAAAGHPPKIEPVASPKAFRDKISDFHGLGYTVRLPEIRKVAPDLDRFLRALELVLQVPVKAEAFWSRGDARAPIHHDDYDIIVIQVRGRKRWFISTDPSDLPNAWRTVPEGPPHLDRCAEVEVEPGDMLYLPRGTTHRVDALADSLHVSIGFVPVTLRDAIIACIDHLSDLDKPLRETVGARVALQALRHDFGAIPANVRAGLAHLSAACAAEGFVADALQRRASRVIADLDSLEKPTSYGPLTPQTRVRHAPLGVSHLTGHTSKIDFAYPGGHHYVHRGVQDSLTFIALTPQFRIGDIPGAIDDEVRVALADKFVASGFLQVTES